MRTLPVKCTTVDMETGKVTEERTVQFGILPPAPSLCQVCGFKHDPAEPHNQQSLHYQYAFYGAAGRLPTWADAVAHCAPATREAWRGALQDGGHWSEPGAGTEPVANLGEQS